MKYKGVIFDLDGVIVSTDNLHYIAWKETADKENIFFNRDINERLRGVSRNKSLEIMLEKAEKHYTEKEKNLLADYKNNIYKKLLLQLKPSDILEGVMDLLIYLKKNNIKIAIGSSSKNTNFILKQIGLENFFNAVVDGNNITKSKPDPEVFIIAAKKLGLLTKDCLVIEDAYAGVDAAIAAGSKVLAVGFAYNYNKADFRAENLKDINIYKIIN